jgi:hypothetical protein
MAEMLDLAARDALPRVAAETVQAFSGGAAASRLARVLEAAANGKALAVDAIEADATPVRPAPACEAAVTS